MDVIRKACLIFIIAALAAFVDGVSIADDNAKVNINTATIEELSALQGIGEKKAKSIVEHREKVGSFTTIEDLKTVKGVGEKIFDKVKHLIVVE